MAPLLLPHLTFNFNCPWRRLPKFNKLVLADSNNDDDDVAADRCGMLQ